MIFYFKNNKVMPIPDTRHEREMVVERFFEVLVHTVFVENHSHKYHNPEQVAQIMNQTAEKLGLDIELIIGANENMYLRCEDGDICKLPALLKAFKYNYRFQHRRSY